MPRAQVLVSFRQIERRARTHWMLFWTVVAGWIFGLVLSRRERHSFRLAKTQHTRSTTRNTLLSNDYDNKPTLFQARITASISVCLSITSSKKLPPLKPKRNGKSRANASRHRPGRRGRPCIPFNTLRTTRQSEQDVKTWIIGSRKEV